jgi:hypothetical protein
MGGTYIKLRVNIDPSSSPAHNFLVFFKYIIQYYIYTLCLDLPWDFCTPARRDIKNVLTLREYFVVA